MYSRSRLSSLLLLWYLFLLMISKKKVLIVEAHSDDSCISVGGFLEKFRDRYEYHFALLANSDLYLHHKGFLSRDERMKEYENYINHFNGFWHKEGGIPFDYDCRLDTLPKKDIVGAIEKVISAVEPDILICQGPSFHHDHSIVYESTIAATRPTARHCPREIYVMENPTYVHSLGPQTDFKPDLYVDISEEELKKKLDCYRRFFPSQIREDKNYLSEEGLRSWARYRGIEARCQYAEALMTYLRVV